jgi:hypothetical protein
MVKNTCGGNRAKSFARKNTQSNHSILFPSNPLEYFAIVSKTLGNGMCYVIIPSLDDPLLCHIRKKFSGRFKKDNLIQAGTFLMVGLREWESTPKNCDVMEVYNHSDLAILKTMPTFSFSNDLISSFSKNGAKAAPKDEEIIFDENADDDDFDLKVVSNEMIQTEEGARINIDDI